MKQLSLLDDAIRLSGVMVAIKTAMRDAAGAPEGEGRKMLADRLNEIAQRAGIKLTGGNTLSISKATLDKWLAPPTRRTLHPSWPCWPSVEPPATWNHSALRRVRWDWI